MDRSLDIYHQLPPSLRSLVASARGKYLETWRYGPETEGKVQEALLRELWTSEQWQTWQKERLAEVLQRAATTVPYYRHYWRERHQRGDNASWKYLENWPILEKETLRQQPRAFVADDCSTRRMFHEHTSGTTGKSLDLWWSRATVRAWYALFEARWRRWYGVSRRDRWAILGGQLIVSSSQLEPPFWVWNSSLRQLYMSSYHLSERYIPYYLDALKQYNVRYIWGYTSSLYALAQVALRINYGGLDLAVAITNAEPVFSYQREAIEKAFSCPVRETYGLSEIVAAASECEVGNLHLWPEVGLVEVLVESEVQSYGITGDLVCTGLINADMPLIRYRTGDRGSLLPPGGLCSCGRILPLLGDIEGRIDDVLYTPDGRSIGRLDPVFKTGLPIIEAQIIQEHLNSFRVRYVPAAGFSSNTKQTITQRLQERLGPVDIVLEAVQMVPRTSSGKFRAVICALPVEERAQLKAFVRSTSGDAACLRG